MITIPVGPVDDPRYDAAGESLEPLTGRASVPSGATVFPMPRYRPLPRPACVLRLIERRMEAT